MSNLLNDTPMPSKRDKIESTTASLGVMLTTTILLIAGLILTGIMMIYYAQARNSTTTETVTTVESEPKSSPAASLLKTFTKTEGQKELDTAPDQPKKSAISQWFDRQSNGTKWPKIKLTGFGTATDGSGGFAIINNRKYREGDLINGKVKLLEIRKYDVELEYQGETNRFSINSAD